MQQVPGTRDNHAFVPGACGLKAECQDKKLTLLATVSSMLRQQPTLSLPVLYTAPM